MSEEKKENLKNTNNKLTTQVNNTVDLKSNNQNRTFNNNNSRQKGGNKREKKWDNKRKETKEFDSKLIEANRVTRMYKGGRRLRFSVFVVVGNKKGLVGVGKGKGPDIRAAQEKAISHAKRNLIKVKLNGNTIFHDVNSKFKAARVLLKPASPGTGIIAGSSVRIIAELAGIKDMLSKILGTSNKITNAYATIEALKSIRSGKI